MLLRKTKEHMSEFVTSWRLKDQRYNLKGTLCEGCGTAAFPPREVCPQCSSERGVNSAQPLRKEDHSSVDSLAHTEPLAFLLYGTTMGAE